MRKLFVSVPMKGYTLDEIRSNQTKLHFLAEKHFNEKFELIDSIILPQCLHLILFIKIFLSILKPSYFHKNYIV